MKNSIKIDVPQGIRYISQWNEFRLEQFPHILDKQIPGCGFTEWCITNSDNVILCSPRKILLENKEEQHSGEVFRVINEYDKGLNVDKDLSIRSIMRSRPDMSQQEKIDATAFSEIKQNLLNYIQFRKSQNLPIKILVTYDSFRIIKTILENFGLFQDFQVIIDEFQSIFTDSRFKSSTEVNFVSALQGVQRVCYVSATPMMREYLDLLDEFKDLPFYELDWEILDNTRVVKPNLHVRVVSSIVTKAREIIQTYLDGKFEKSFSKGYEVQSNEAVIYVNSVNNILLIIKKCGLTPDQCNILCSNTPENLKKVKRKLGKKWSIGKVPLRNEPRKMFTFCTRTVYLGADFYSTCARSFILSDANIQTLAVDISLDLPQILGRQRLSENPWKNEAEFYYKAIVDKNNHKVNQDSFKAEIKRKLIETQKLLDAFSDTRKSSKDTLADRYKKLAATFNYSDDYVAVDEVSGSMMPVQNRLVIVAEKRAFDIQKYDYADRFSVFNTIDQSLEGTADIQVNLEVTKFLSLYRDCKNDIMKRIRLFCETNLSDKARDRVVSLVDEKTRTYYSLGLDILSKTSYDLKDFDRLLSESQLNLSDSIYQEFKEGIKLSKADIKSKLQIIYENSGSKRKAKASDLEKYFELKSCKVKNSQTGKWEHGFELVKKLE
jgi:hypothetical protein